MRLTPRLKTMNVDPQNLNHKPLSQEEASLRGGLGPRNREYPQREAQAHLRRREERYNPNSESLSPGAGVSRRKVGPAPPENTRTRITRVPRTHSGKHNRRGV